MLGSVAFVVLRLPVSDLQAADARAAAAAHGVGLAYWLSWFGGSAPGDYSILTPAVTAAIGVTVTGALATVAVSLLARPVLAGTRRPRSGAYLVTLAALSDLWSGRVAFSLGAAVALLALLALRRGRPVLGGVVNVVTALISPVAAVCLLLALSGPLVIQRRRRRGYLRFGLLSLAGLAVPAVMFGVPGAMPFAWSTMAWTVAIPLALLVLARQLPAHVRVTLYLAVAAVVVLHLIPNGMGANIQRFSFLVLPPLVWTLSRAGRVLTLIALSPALVYAGYNTISDVAAATAPSAQPAYYAALHTALLHQPLLPDHRVEVIDTTTHGAAAALAGDIYLARGWEAQADTGNNPIFYQPGALTAAGYRTWLDDNAVAYVAVPSRPGDQYAGEVALVGHSLPYLHPAWRNADWTVYAVAHPQPIVAAPDRLVSAGPSSLTIDVPEPGTVTLRIRPSRYLHLVGAGAHPRTLCVAAVTATSARVQVPVAGIYRLDSSITAAGIVDPDTCR